MSNNKNSQYDPGLIVKEVHDFHGQSIRTTDTNSVADKYFTHFRATYDGLNNPLSVTYFRGVSPQKTEIGVKPDVNFSLAGKYIAFSSAPDNKKHYIWFRVDGIGTDPALPNAIGLAADIQENDAASVVALVIHQLIKQNWASKFFSQRASAVVQINTVGFGLVDASTTNTGFVIANTPGTQVETNSIAIEYDNGSPLYQGQVLKGMYFNIFSGKFERSNAEITVSEAAANVASIQNIPMAIANQEYSITLPINTLKFTLRVRDSKGKLQLSWNAGETSTNYLTVGMGVTYSEDSLERNGTSRIIYVSSSTPDLTIELMSWS